MKRHSQVGSPPHYADSFHELEHLLPHIEDPEDVLAEYEEQKEDEIQ